MSPMLSAALVGFVTGFSLILAIGAQNAFVLRQGLRGEHVFVVCLTCALADATLIALGVSSFSVVAEILPGIEVWLRLAGAAFLVWYGASRLVAAARGASGSLEPACGGPAPLGRVIATCLAFTVLNPHVYLDTVVLIGSIAASQFAGRESAFGVGAVAASFVFFFSLGYGARLLRPVFARPAAWRVLDAGIGVTMFALALMLIVSG